MTFALWGLGFGIILVVLIIVASYVYYSSQLPPIDALKDAHLQTPLRIYSSDDKLIAEFGRKRRIPVRFNQIPTSLIHAFMAAEDSDFYTNNGVDVSSLLRAAWELLSTGHIQTGGSTITMQVARNFFLSPERAFSRKFKEILLALRITKELSKEDIMTLYLNKIYLGNRAYGVQAAANVYYGKSINNLSLDQMAMIAGLPKAPSSYNPLANSARALERRNWILSRMLKLSYISKNEYENAALQPVSATYHAPSIQLYAPYIAEMVRQELVKNYGDKTYTNGLKVYTTINSKNQTAAQEAIVKGLQIYDRRHGYRGPVKKLGTNNNVWHKTLDEASSIANLLPAVVTQTDDKKVHILLKNNKTGIIKWKDMSWAKPTITINRTGKSPQKPTDVLSVGDQIYVTTNHDGTFNLGQLPQAQAALVSINPSNGEIKALIGGFDFYESHFNRAIQASRQIGSAIKPFIYSAALAQGMTAATLINDAPVVIENPQTEEDWRPHNDDSKFNGPMRFRQALYQSRNLVSIRVLQKTGIDNTLNYITKLGLPATQLPGYLSLALGSADIKPLQLAKGYSTLANGGYRITPYLIKKITSSTGLIFSSSPLHVCNNIHMPANNKDNMTQPAIQTNDDDPKMSCAPSVMSAQVNYIINSIMQDVIKKGTGRRALVLDRGDLAGKTGTTNLHKDSWFAGYNPKLLAVVWAGNDNSSTLGQREFGSTVALPIWINYMRIALKGTKEIRLPLPSGLVLMRIDKKTGGIAGFNDPDSYFEIFRKQYAPSPKNQSALNFSGKRLFQPGDIY